MNGTVRPVLRFAPSPNGPLHLGHALSVLTGLDWARRLGGRFRAVEDLLQVPGVGPKTLEGLKGMVEVKR